MKINLPGIFHDFRYYDTYFRLRIPFRLWLIIFYGIKHSVVFMLVGVLGSPSTDVLAVLGSPFFLPASGLALIVIFAGHWRVAGAAQWKRRLWRKSHFLLVFSYALSVVVLSILHVWPVTQGEQWTPTVLTAVLFFDFNILIYLLFSTLIRDVFLDFPEQHDVQYWYFRIFTH